MPFIAARSASADADRMLPSVAISCPYCGEPIELMIDVMPTGEPAGEQRYIEDCQVCCRPITVIVTIDGDGQPHVHALAEDDA